MAKSILSFISLAAAIIFAAAGLYAPPPGEIDGSVLMIVAQFLMFCATMVGAEAYVDKMRDYMQRLKQK